MNIRKTLISLLLVTMVTMGFAQNGQWGRLGSRQFTGGNVSRPIGLPNGTVGAPALFAILDPNTGAYWLGNDQFGLSAGGINAQWISEGNGEVSTIFGANRVQSVGGVGSTAGFDEIGKTDLDADVDIGDVVIIYANTADDASADFGLYIVTKVSVSDSLTLDRAISLTRTDLSINILADGVVIENSTNPLKTRIIMGLSSAPLPSLAFFDGKIGVGAISDNDLFFTTRGVTRFIVAGNSFRANLSTGGGIENAAATATLPTILPRRASPNDGMGSGGAGQVSIIANNVEIVRYVEAAADYVEHKVGTVYTPSGDQERADGSTITIDNTIIRVFGADADALLNAIPAIEDGITDGQIIIIQGTTDANTVSIVDNVNTQLAGGATMTLGKGDTIQLIWDAGDSDWYEVSRSDN